jgi:hypothetical protein
MTKVIQASKKAKSISCRSYKQCVSTVMVDNRRLRTWRRAETPQQTFQLTNLISVSTNTHKRHPLIGGREVNFNIFDVGALRHGDWESWSVSRHQRDEHSNSWQQNNWYVLYYLDTYSNRSGDTLNCSSQAIEPLFAIIRYGALLVTIEDCVPNDERRQQNMAPNGLYSLQWVLTYIELIP